MKRALLVFAGLVVLVVSSKTGAAQEEQLLEIKISGPKEGPQFVTLQGVAKGFPAGKVFLRVIVLPKGDICYLQDGPNTPPAMVGRDGKFEIKAQIGRPGATDRDQLFTLWVIAYDKDKKLPKIGVAPLELRAEPDLRDALKDHVFRKDQRSVSNAIEVIRK